MLPKDHARKMRKLRILSKRLDRMMEKKSFSAVPFWRRYAPVRRVKRLYGALLGSVSPGATRAILAGAVAVALAARPTPEAPKADNPTFAAAVPAFVDIDNDGDFDPLVGDGAGDLWFCVASILLFVVPRGLAG